MRRFGLIGFPLGHSFSKAYFSKKFEDEGLAAHTAYELYPLEDIGSLPALLEKEKDLSGLNVTLPHKQAVLPWLDELDESAAGAGAVNTIKIVEGRLLGYNTDVYGFETSLLDFLRETGQTLHGLSALVLGTGGASRAVVFVLKKLGVPFRILSRNSHSGDLTYSELKPDTLQAHRLVINTTPLGMYPHLDTCPDLPYQAILPGQLFFDLVYNPGKSLFLAKAEAKGAFIQNGLPMLHLQAEKAWEIWNKKHSIT
jgi:shikimate dehydrogenase